MLEHQSTVDETMAFRILRYMIFFWSLFFKQNQNEKEYPLIFPLVFYQGENGKTWNKPKDLHSFLKVPNELKPFVPQYQFAVWNLQDLNENEMKGITPLRLNPKIMKHIKDPTIIEYMKNELIPLLQGLDSHKRAIEYLEDFLSTIAKEMNYISLSRSLSLLL